MLRAGSSRHVGIKTAHPCEVVRSKRWPNFQDGIVKSQFCSKSTKCDSLRPENYAIDLSQWTNKSKIGKHFCLLYIFLAFCRFVGLVYHQFFRYVTRAALLRRLLSKPCAEQSRDLSYLATTTAYIIPCDFCEFYCLSCFKVYRSLLS